MLRTPPEAGLTARAIPVAESLKRLNPLDETQLVISLTRSLNRRAIDDGHGLHDFPACAHNNVSGSRAERQSSIR